MAAEAPIPTASEATSDTVASSAPRKRRRRTAASGAADDCFSCRKKAVPCDRKRPYCSQCLESGKECSGYKTTLTWGVGVASRGKLRGLSLPVATSQQVMKTEDKAPPQRRRKSTASSISSNISGISTMGSSVFNAMLPPVHESQPIKIEHDPHSLRLDIPPVPQTWSDYRFANQDIMTGTSMSSSSSMRMGAPIMNRPFVMSPSQESPFPSSVPSVGTFSDSGYMSHHDFPPTPMVSSYAERMPSYPYSTTDNSVGSGVIPEVYHRTSPYSDDCTSSGHAVSVIGYQDGSLEQQESASLGSRDDQSQLATQDDVFQHFEMALDDMLGAEDHTATDMALTLDRPIFSNQFFHLPPRMQSLLDFYDKHICSVLVAFDSDSNPYRAHILSLAAHNLGLQNAIAALATNNIRMRSQKQLQVPGFVQELEEIGPDALSESRLVLSAPTPEEACYKAISIEQLNMQLAHASSAENDAVLATLLVLCLFHVCDSGFTKFKTQLAGVQKLLSLRGNAPQGGFTGWVQMFFTWFDVMCSTVNDRETEIHNSSSDMLDFSTDLGVLEEFSGCDGRLFKLIARLGRLNLLAQGRPVRAKDGTVPMLPQLPPDWRRPVNRADTMRKAGLSHPQDLYSVSDNGWPASPNQSIFPDHRTNFWHEWHDIRSRLQSWTMDYSSIPGPRSATADLTPDQRDIVHINESFRAAALLYTERLANPDLPSAAPNLQQLVAQGLFHITALPITSCVNKFLLWPLFVIGTECAEPTHRATVRARCVEIQRESGFFNNLSVLEVLERAWRDPEAYAPAEGDAPQPFRWRRAMSKVDGEYIVV